MSQAKKGTPGSPGWWREPMMWLVVGGPLAVVLASVATITLAIKHPDPVLTEQTSTSSSGEQVADFRTGGASSGSADIPALQARNHAATGGR